MMITKIFGVHLAKYDDHEPVDVVIPLELSSLLTQEEQEKLKSVCMTSYRQAKETLNESIADVSVQDPGALDFAGELSKRLLIIMNIVADLNLDERTTENRSSKQLNQLGIAVDDSQERPKSFLQELKQGEFRRILMSLDSEHEAGYVGLSPLSIKHASEGNLRERMYIPYKSTHEFTERLFSKPENIVTINQVLEQQHFTWRINQQAIQIIRSQTQNGRLYQYGAYANSRRGSRVILEKRSHTQYLAQNPSVKKMQQARIPLSQREILAQTHDLDPVSDKRVKWLPGEAFFKVEDNHQSHPSLHAAHQTGDVMLTGVSGTTDSILTLGYFMGMFDDQAEERMQDALVACMGWMIDCKDHSAHEIQTSAKSFGLPYTACPDSYKQIRPNDKAFLRKLCVAQQNRGALMPDEILSPAYLMKLASDLFPEVLKKKMQNMKTEWQSSLQPDDDGEAAPRRHR